MEAPGLPAWATLALTNWTRPVSLPGEDGARRMSPAQGPDTDPSDQRPWWAAASTGNVTTLQGRDPASGVTLQGHADCFGKQLGLCPQALWPRCMGASLLLAFPDASSLDLGPLVSL